VRRLLLFALALALTGCGGGRDHGTATVWVTRDRGATLLHDETVPAGLTAMQALDRVADVKTRYGGRFVQSVDGLEGDASRRRDWFYFVNGIEADVGAAEYRLHDGDVEWWDFRSWQTRMRQPVVVGAFPEPFVHGFDGKPRPTIVRYDGAANESAAHAIAKLVHAKKVIAYHQAVGLGPNVIDIGKSGAYVRISIPDGGTTDPVHASLGARAAARIAADPALLRYRYTGLP
jgi:hypothetical protein